MHRTKSRSGHREALLRIVEANRRVARNDQALASDANRAADELQSAVDDARALGVSWGGVGDVLGMRRGAAYQRFQRFRRADRPRRLVATVDERLHGAHLDLMARRRTDTTAPEIARGWGFDHFGRFAVTYRRTYGESPHTTLRHAAGGPADDPGGP